jgi:hypothetical protein
MIEAQSAAVRFDLGQAAEVDRGQPARVCRRVRSMSDFCLGPQAIADITRQTGLMQRMGARVGIDSRGTGRSSDPSLWYEARLKCIGCAVSRQCVRFLASPGAKGQAPMFCPNRTFFAAASQRVSNPGRSK